MRYSAASKYEIIRTVEESALGIGRTCAKLGISRSTFYNWYDRYLSGGYEALEDKRPCPISVWNKVPGAQRKALIDLALDEPELSPRELAVRFTEERGYFISEASAYRILKDHDLLTSPVWIVMKATDKFDNPTTAINQLWQTDSPISRLQAGAGIISQQLWMITAVISSAGSFVLVWPPRMSLPR